MDKLKYVKLENPDGSYSDSIPLSVSAEHVDISSKNSINLADYININDNNIDNLKTSTLGLSNEIKSLASGSPKGSYNTTSDLITDNPDTGVYVVFADGHLYSYIKNNDNVIDLGVYQAISIADESVNYKHLDNALKNKINYLTTDNAIIRIEDFKSSAIIKSGSQNLEMKLKVSIEPTMCYYIDWDNIVSTAVADDWYFYIAEYDINGVRKKRNAINTKKRYFETNEEVSYVDIYYHLQDCSVAGDINIENFRLYKTDVKEYSLTESIGRKDLSDAVISCEYGFNNHIITKASLIQTPLINGTNKVSAIVNPIDANLFDSDVYMTYEDLQLKYPVDRLSIRVYELDNNNAILERHDLSYTDESKLLHFTKRSDTAYFRIGINYNNNSNDNDIIITNLIIYSNEHKIELSSDVYIEEVKELGNSIDNITNSISEINSEMQLIKNGNIIGGSSKGFLKYLLPAYWKSDGISELYINNKIRDIQKINADTRFTWITDQHWQSNAKHSIDLVGYVNANCQIENTLNGGDIMGDVKSSPTIELANYHLWECMDEWFDKIPFKHYFAFGNHDLNRTNPPAGMSQEDFLACRLSYKTVYESCIKPWSELMHFSDNPDWPETNELYYWNRMHYYFDDDKAKIRYICLNTGTGGQPFSSTVSNYTKEMYRQLTWLYDTLMSMENGWSFLVFGHQFFADGTQSEEHWSWNQHTTPVAQLMLGAKNKTIVIPGGESQRYSWVQDSYDFTDAPDITPICLLCGHHHADFSMIFDDSTMSAENGNIVNTEHQLLAICTTCDTKGSVHYQYEMTEGTTTEQAFDIVSIDKENKKIIMSRIGVGNDREFYY